ncbi:hypothetical protein TONV_023 [Tipula oleracea nudivirus]|uniref:Uncharacterized protein n=1 Tax=Tipula oleracea nudivirus TaxID=1546257 RepID=A0A0B4VGJ1_9VIRU|nr:hypothetical protein TONV_023 [Tipula oleracea nudivirus]AJD20083.1 hypothetical protein TONV_023 [Tipula oleracea nudivirus]
MDITQTPVYYISSYRINNTRPVLDQLSLIDKVQYLAMTNQCETPNVINDIPVGTYIHRIMDNVMFADVMPISINYETVYLDNVITTQKDLNKHIFLYKKVTNKPRESRMASTELPLRYSDKPMFPSSSIVGVTDTQDFIKCYNKVTNKPIIQNMPTISELKTIIEEPQIQPSLKYTDEELLRQTRRLQAELDEITRSRLAREAEIEKIRAERLARERASSLISFE